MKRYLNVLFSVFILLLVSCSKNKQNNYFTDYPSHSFEDFINEFSTNKKIEEDKNEEKNILNHEDYLINPENHQTIYEPYYEIVESDFFGTSAITTINSDNTCVFLQPDIKSLQFGTLRRGDKVRIVGFSDSVDENGYFVKIWIDKDFVDYYHDCYTSVAWILLKDTDLPQNLDCNTFVYSDSGICRKQENEITPINCEIINNGYKDFPIFIWCSCCRDFIYNDPVGIFMIDTSNNEIKHLTNIGCIEESAWSFVTDDKKLVVEEFGTYIGLRGLKIFEISTNKILYSGLYLGTLGGLQKDGDFITIVERYSEWDIRHKMISEESIKIAESFKQNFDIEELYEKEIIILSKLNLLTMEKKFISVELINEI
ncbi:MAG: hypothetical protein K6C97_08085 [Treponema sp.]|nr:hypothetical protein [Treponema sp.]